MCKDIEHGGERCPADTSEARRFRRKTSKILASSSPRKLPTTFEPITPLSESMTRLKERAEGIKKNVYKKIPEGETQASWDSKVEKRLTSLGLALGIEAEKIADYDAAKMNKLIDAKMEELYAPQNKIVRKISEEQDKLDDQWGEILEKYKDNEEVKFGIYQRVDRLSPEQVACLTEEEVELVNKASKLINKSKDEHAKFEDVDKEYDAYRESIYAEANAKLASAYQEVLAQIRPLGGKINHEVENGDPEAGKLITETVGAHYPSEWLQKHNDDPNEKVTIKFEKDGRPSYSSEVFSETEDDGIVKNTYTTYGFSAGKKEQIERIKEAFGPDLQAGNFTILKLQTWRKETYYSMQGLSKAEERYSEETHGKLVNGKPVGEGWEYKTSVTSFTEAIGKENIQDEEKIMQFLEKKVWVKPMETTAKKTKVLTVFSDKSMKTMNEKENSSYDLNKAVAYHEFGHRMEEVLPNNALPRLEKAFLARRSGKTEDNWYEDMIETGSANEYGHEAKLVTRYAGRDYFTGSNYEVFTVGVESLYGGAYGGLLGNSKNGLKEDKDHRGFVLGVMASL